MKTFKNIDTLKARLEKGICWGDWIKVAGKEYKMVEYGDGSYDNYMLFQNKKTTNIIEIRYITPCFKWVDGQRIQTKQYAFNSIEEYTNGELYRY